MLFEKGEMKGSKKWSECLCSIEGKVILGKAFKGFLGLGIPLGYKLFYYLALLSNLFMFLVLNTVLFTR